MSILNSRTLILCFAASLALACGSSDEESSGGNAGGGAAGSGAAAGGAGAAGTGGVAGSAGIAGSGGVAGTGAGETGGAAGLGGGGTGGGCGDTSSDPANCGVCGNDCNGGECVEGVCQPIVLRNDYHGSNFVIDDAELFYVQQAYANDPMEVMSGPLTPMATDSSLGVVDEMNGDLRAAGGNIFWEFTGGEYPNYTTQIAYMSKQGGTVTTMDDDVDGFVPADDRVFVVVKGELYSRPLSGGSLTKLTDQTPDWAYYLTDKLFGDGDYLFVAKTGGSGQGRVLFRIPTNGSAGSIVVDLPGWLMDLTFNSASMFGVSASPYAECSSSPTSKLWSAPKSGGTVSTLVTHPSVISNAEADESFVYFADKCDGSLWRVATAGGTAEKLVEELGSNYEPTLMLDDNGLYFVNTDTDQLLQLPK